MSTTTPITTKRYFRTHIEVEAVQYVEPGLDIVLWVRANHGTAHWNWAVDAWTSEGGESGFPAQPEHILLDTVVGLKRVEIGDWIVKGEEGEFYTYAKEDFERDFQQMDIPIKIIELSRKESV